MNSQALYLLEDSTPLWKIQYTRWFGNTHAISSSSPTLQDRVAEWVIWVTDFRVLIPKYAIAVYADLLAHSPTPFSNSRVVSTDSFWTSQPVIGTHASIYLLDAVP
jgi:hypothetical protein